MQKTAALIGALFLLLLAGHDARAEEQAPSSVTTTYSRYELKALREAEQRLETTVDPGAEGKIIERIDAVRLDPIEPDDIVPRALNKAHVTTKEEVVLHEVLLRVGERYRKVTADESARNIRQFMRVSTVLVVPMRGSAPDRVRVVVVTKDVWSLIFDVDFHVSSGGLESMMIEVEETNLIGQQVELSGHTLVQPESAMLGVLYVAPRFAGRWLSFRAEGDVIVNRRSGELEGSVGEAKVEHPLFTTRSNWAWATGVRWSDQIYRRYSNAQVATFEGSLPWAYRARGIEQHLSATRSFGWARKNDVSLGVSLTKDLYRLPDPEEYNADVVARFTRQVLPVGETRSTPYVQLRTYRNDFLRIVDFETLGLQEDYRLGYDLVLRGYPVTQALASTRDFFGVRAGAVYTLPLGDGFVRALLDSQTEIQVERISDASITGELRIVSPRTPGGRLIFDVMGMNRWRNYLNRLSLMGGEDRLRGWPTRYFVGKNTFAMNLEFRTRALELGPVQVGGAFFYDNGRAFNGSFTEVSPVHSVGFGLRVVLPQIDRSVVRGDFGFPVTAGDLPADVLPMSFYFSFGQAFRATHMIPPFGP